MCKKPKIYIRADGNSEIGLGHVIRSLALAEMLKEDFSCIFATRFLTDYIHTEARKVCDDVIKLPESDDHFEAFLSCLSGDEIVVLDNYFFDTDYQKAIKNKGCKLVCIDDIHDTHFVADVVINHTGGVTADAYSVELYTQLCLGVQYVLLRKDFLKAAPMRNNFTANNNLLICLGGADPHNHVLQILRWLQEKQLNFKCHLVLGNAFLHKQEIDIFLQNTTLHIQTYHNLSSKDMVELMQQCSQAICAPSSISMEYLTVRGGTLYLQQIADNQKEVLTFYRQKKLGFELSQISLLSPPIPSKQSLNLFDGISDKRINKFFKMLSI